MYAWNQKEDIATRFAVDKYVLHSMKGSEQILDLSKSYTSTANKLECSIAHLAIEQSMWL